MRTFLICAWLCGLQFSEAAPDSESGELAYAQCIGCHSFGYHRTGPDHCGLVGRIAGSQLGFEYTQAMRESRIVWNAETLDRFLQSPLNMVPGTAMGFAGIADADLRAAVVGYIYLQQNSDECKST